MSEFGSLGKSPGEIAELRAEVERLTESGQNWHRSAVANAAECLRAEHRAEAAEAEVACLASVVAAVEALADEWTAEADRLQEFADRHQGYYQGIVSARRTCRDDLHAVLASVGVSGSADDRREADASQAPDTATEPCGCVGGPHGGYTCEACK